jgi:peptide/nickel transport system substrate-binding protein
VCARHSTKGSTSGASSRRCTASANPPGWGRLPYDPDKAKALLAEAGYPQGFSVRFDCTARHEPACHAIGAMLAQIAIGVDVALWSDELGQKVQTRTSDFFWWGYTEPFDSLNWFKDRYRSDADFAGTGYADPEVDALIDQIEGRWSPTCGMA